MMSFLKKEYRKRAARKQRKQTENRYKKVCFPGSSTYTEEKSLGKQRKHFFKVNYRNLYIHIYLYSCITYKGIDKFCFLGAL